ncbi:MAG: sensor domain-containing diguanylate cyclase [Deltaproteobacteria bacterium]|nr:sensor domain-containing diguanylate cyclase [Deltaproteobacteria bacterium]
MKPTGIQSLDDSNTLRGFVHNLREGIYITTLDGRILDANPAFLQMFGATSLDELQGCRTVDLLVDPLQREREVDLLLEGGTVREFEFQIRRLDGMIRTVLDTCFAMRDPATGDTVFHGILVDITGRKDLEEQLREVGIRDPLTGLYNRRFLEEVEADLELRPRPLGAIVVDVDHFKDYNDQYGHRMGDEVLRHVARFLSSQVRADDIVFRIGGDEFLALLFGDGFRHTRTVARRMRDAASQRGTPVPLTLGWAVSRNGESIERTVNRADKNLIRVRIRVRGDERRGHAAVRPLRVRRAQKQKSPPAAQHSER